MFFALHSGLAEQADGVQEDCRHREIPHYRTKHSRKQRPKRLQRLKLLPGQCSDKSATTQRENWQCVCAAVMATGEVIIYFLKVNPNIKHQVDCTVSEYILFIYVYNYVFIWFAANPNVLLLIHEVLTLVARGSSMPVYTLPQSLQVFSCHKAQRGQHSDQDPTSSFKIIPCLPPASKKDMVQSLWEVRLLVMCDLPCGKKYLFQPFPTNVQTKSNMLVWGSTSTPWPLRRQVQWKWCLPFCIQCIICSSPVPCQQLACWGQLLGEKLAA